MPKLTETPVNGSAQQDETSLLPPHDEVARFRYDVAARTAIDLATGILMEQRGIGADEARQVLEHLSDPDGARTAR